MPHQLPRDVIESLVGDHAPAGTRTRYQPYYMTIAVPHGPGVPGGLAYEQVQALKARFRGLGFDVSGTGHAWGLCLNEAV
jgi:hypothetical protein